MNDREIADLIRTSLGYKTFVGPIDKSKVEAARIGIRKPSPSSKEGRAAWELYLRDPPPPVPSPSPLADVWRLDAAFTEGGLSNFAGAVRSHAFQLGWRAVYVQLLNTGYSEANEHEMSLSPWNQWTKVGWGTYGQGTDPYQDGKQAASMCKRLPILKGWKANGETWAEGESSWKTEAFLRGWRDGGAPVPLGWSVNSSDTANFARPYAYDVALSSPGSDIDPQVYGADHPGLTVGACLGMLSKADVPVNRTTMSFSVTGTGTGPFNDYRTWPGPRRLWRPDKATIATFDALVR